VLIVTRNSPLLCPIFAGAMINSFNSTELCKNNSSIIGQNRIEESMEENPEFKIVKVFEMEQYAASWEN